MSDAERTKIKADVQAVVDLGQMYTGENPAMVAATKAGAELLTTFLCDINRIADAAEIIASDGGDLPDAPPPANPNVP